MDRHTKNQNRAHKQNLGILEAHEARMQEIEKDRKKRFQAIEQELIENHRCLETIKANSGHSISFEEAYPEEFRKHARKLSLLDQQTEKRKQSKSSIMKMEVQMRKALCESRFKVRSGEFFEKWGKALRMDLEIDFDGLEDVDSKNEDWLQLQKLVESYKAVES